MATSKAGFTKGTSYSVKGRPATFDSTTKGWHSFTTPQGDVIRARAKDVKPLGKVKDFEPGTLKFVTEDDEGNPRVSLFDASKYKKHNVRTESGNKVFDNNDSVSAKLRKLETLDEKYKFVAGELKKAGDDTYGGSAKKIDDNLRVKYGHLNPGQQRMLLGNVLRGTKARVAKAKAK